MQGSFEKGVQGKLDGLRLDPSTPVWEKIELQIRPEKKRRRVFFWLFFLAILLAGGGWLYFSSIESGRKDLASKSVNTAKENKLLPNRRLQKSQPATGSQTRNLVATKSTKKELATKPKAIPTQPNVVTRNGEEAKASVVSSEKKSARPDVFSPENSATPFQNLAQEKGSLMTEAATTKREKAQPSLQTTEQAKATQKTTSFTDSDKGLLPSAVLSQPVSKPDSTQAKKKVASAGKKWQKQVLLQAGWSGYSPVSSFNYNLSPLYSTTPGPVASYAGGEGSVSKGFSFAVGVGVARSIGTRWTFTAGVQYAYYSTQSKVGSFRRIDTLIASGNNNFSADKSSVSGYYVVGQEEAHNNAFHYVEIPVGFSYQLLKKIPLQLSAGAVYGRLLHTTALTYNASAGIYYIDETASNKQSLGLFTSLQYTAGKSKPAISFGPKLQYGATAVQKATTGSTRHLWFAGLQTAIHF